MAADCAPCNRLLRFGDCLTFNFPVPSRSSPMNYGAKSRVYTGRSWNFANVFLNFTCPSRQDLSPLHQLQKSLRRMAQTPLRRTHQPDLAIHRQLLHLDLA
jgi:hypothetical protein